MDALQKLRERKAKLAERLKARIISKSTGAEPALPSVLDGNAPGKEETPAQSTLALQAATKNQVLRALFVPAP